jgi:hypothetical protein
MKRRLAYLWRRHRIMTLLFLAALGLAAVLAVRTVMFTVYWMDPAHHDAQLQGWMTPRYVAMSYHLPPDIVGEALSIDPDTPPLRQTLAQIAARTGRSVAEMQVLIEAAAADFRARGQ